MSVTAVACLLSFEHVCYSCCLFIILPACLLPLLPVYYLSSMSVTAVACLLSFEHVCYSCCLLIFFRACLLPLLPVYYLSSMYVTAACCPFIIVFVCLLLVICRSSISVIAVACFYRCCLIAGAVACKDAGKRSGFKEETASVDVPWSVKTSQWHKHVSIDINRADVNPLKVPFFCFVPTVAILRPITTSVARWHSEEISTARSPFWVLHMGLFI